MNFYSIYKSLKKNHLKYKIIVNISLTMEWILRVLAVVFFLKMSLFYLIVGLIFIYLSFRYHDFTQSYTRYYWGGWINYQNVPKPNRLVRRKVARKMKNDQVWH